MQRSFADVATLAKASHASVRGVLGPVIDRQVDDGGLGAAAAAAGGIPMAYRRFTVRDRGIGSAAIPTQITIGWIDTDAVQTAEATPLIEGQEYVLFLERLTPSLAPGAGRTGEWFIPMGGDAGVFRVVKGQALATDSGLVGVTAGERGARVGDRLAVDPANLLRLPTS